MFARCKTDLKMFSFPVSTGSFDDPETQSHKTQTKCQVSLTAYNIDLVPCIDIDSSDALHVAPQSSPVRSQLARLFCLFLLLSQHGPAVMMK